MTRQKNTNGRTQIHAAVPAFFRLASRISPSLAGRLARLLFLRTRRHPVPEREAAVLESAERHELATERGRAVAWVWGRPMPADAREPTIYLLHGWEGRGSQLGPFVGPLRRAGFRVVAVDAPGHGEAPGRSSSLVALGAALEAAVERWSPDSGEAAAGGAGVIAHSAAAVGATWALSRGLPVERAFFVAPGADIVAYTRYYGGLLGLSSRAVRELAIAIERRIGVLYAELEPLRLAPEMTVPLHVVTDRDDDEAPLPSVEKLVRSWPGATLRVTEDLGHRRILRDREVVEEAVRFFTGAASPATRPGGGASDPVGEGRDREVPELAEAGR
jgi:pimeloyl-ACP methyl ester carboxylesterase